MPRLSKPLTEFAGVYGSDSLIHGIEKRPLVTLGCHLAESEVSDDFAGDNDLSLASHWLDTTAN